MPVLIAFYNQNSRREKPAFTHFNPFTMSLIDTLIDPLRSGYSGQLDAKEWRASRYGALEAFREQSKGPDKILSDEDITNIKKSFGIYSRIPVLDMPTVSIGSVRNCIVQPDQNNSRMVVLTFVSYVWGFTMIPSMYVNNTIKYEMDFQKKARKYLLQLLKVMDAASLAKLNTDRNTVFGNLTYEYPVIGNALQVPAAKREDVYNQITGIMGTADYPAGSYDVVANSGHEPLVNKLARNGNQNADNTRATLIGFDNKYTNNMTQNAGVRDTLFVIPDGTLAIENRNDPDARMGSRALGGGQQWDEVDMPMLEMKVGSYYTDRCADATTIFPTAETQGLTRAKMEGFEFSTDVTYVTSYVSDRATKIAPIQKIEISAT